MCDESMPALEPVFEPVLAPARPLEVGRRRFVSVLAQIEIASCFRKHKEPLFQILSPLIYAMVDL